MAARISKKAHSVKKGKAPSSKKDKAVLKTADTSILCNNQNNALQVLFPLDFEDELDAIRCEFDRSYLHWKPHINVIWPFISGKLCSHTSLLSLGEAIESSPSFTLRFDAASVQVRKSPSKKPNENSRAYIVLTPQISPPEAFLSLQQRIQEALHLDGVRASVPHLTIAQVPIGEAVSRIEAWQSQLFPPEIG